MLYAHHPIVKRLGAPLVVVVDVLVGPVAAPFNAQRVVHVVADHHQPAIRGAFVEVEVVLVADVIVPVSDEDFNCSQLQEAIDVKHRLQCTLKFSVAR